MNCPLCNNLDTECLCEGIGLFTIADPDGHLIHTHVSTTPTDAIEDFIKTEQTMNVLYNAARVTHGRDPKCAESWEAFEAKGYRLARVQLTEVPPAPRPA